MALWRSSLGAEDAAKRRRLVRALAAVVLLSLVWLPTPGLAGCDPDDDACLEQDGNNEAEVDVDAEAQGGDAIAGSQVITVTGGGDSTIVANNNSRFSRAKGGDVKGTSETTINNGPTLEIEKPSSSATANASGAARTTQAARPNVTITLDQFSLPTGTASLSSTALASNFAMGTNFLSQSPLGFGAVNQTIDQMGSAPLSSSVMPVVNIAGDNTSFVTGAAPVTQTATARSSPTALAVGGGSATAAASGDAVLAQVAAPSVIMSLDQFAAPTGGGLVSNAVGSSVRLDATNEAIGGGGPVEQVITQSGSSPVTSTVAPTINVTANNTATITGSAPVSQTGTASTAPRATALGGLLRTSASLFQVGNNVESVEVDMTLVGGDAIAGSNVIGVAGAGNTTVVATNESLFARAQGGNAEADVLTNIVGGPRLTVSGATAGLFANATGVASESQTAAIAGTAALDQNADADATAALLSLVSSNVTLDALNTTTTVGGPVSQTINQAGVSPITQPLLGTFGVAGSNAATVFWRAGVVQAANVESDPQSVVAPEP